MIPPQDFRVLITYANLAGMLVVSVAVGLFTSILRKAGYQVDLFESTFYATDETTSPDNRVKFLQARPFNYDDWGVAFKTDLLGDYRRKVEDFAPDLILYHTVEDTWLQAVNLAECIRDLEIPSVFGGIFTTSAPEKALAFSAVSMIGVGEGETIVSEVAERVRTGRDVADVPGLWIKRVDGTIIRNARGALEDINKPLPDYSLFDEKRFYRPMGGKILKTVPLETYRGCSYQCTFCSSPLHVTEAKSLGLGDFRRAKRMDRLAEEIQYLISRHSPDIFYVIDDSFLARPDSDLDALADLYAQFRVPFWFNTRPENIDPKNLDRLRRMNAWRMSVGVECGNQDFRFKYLKRYSSNAKLLKHFDWIRHADFAWSVNNVIGFPDETRSLVFETIEFNRKIIGSDSLTVSIFTPYSGTELRTLAEQKGYLDPATITTHTTSSSLLDMPPPYLSQSDIDQLMRTFALYVAMPKERWSEIERAESEDAVFAELQKEYRQAVWGDDPERGGMP